jgi:beta-glucosidase
MLKHFTIALLAIPLCVCAQSTHFPQLGKDPVDKVINVMTLDEKLDMLIGSGGNIKSDASAAIGNSSVLVPGAAGQLNAIPRLGIPNTVLADGPAGLRIQPTRQGTSNTFYCTHFPIETVMSSTWNTSLVKSVGEALGEEVKHYGVDVLLAPATNIQRNPLNGRNFEYYSEDPLLAGKITAAMILGVQMNGVGTSLKHFALNNQETNRMNDNVIGTSRTFREIYLKSFEIAVKDGKPWTVMTSYNKINGTCTSERSDLVTEILRHEWGFDGMVMSDWFGGQQATLQMEAGNDLLMPGKLSQREVIRKAVLNGTLSMEIIDRNVKCILEYILKTPHFKGYVADNNPDLKAHAMVTRKAALEGMVLLKNTKNALPLNAEVKKIAVFGRTSYDFIAGGTGSGDVNHAYVISLIEGMNNAGFSIDGNLQDTYNKYISEAKAQLPKAKGPLAIFLPKKLIPEMDLANVGLESLAQNNDVAVITIGKTSGEGSDRSIATNFNLTDGEKKMINDVTTAFHKKGKKVVVILNVCGVIETKSWANQPDAVLVSWLPGQEGGNSVADILTGKESPSGRLPMTWPVSYNDVPSENDFPTPDSISDDEILKGFTDTHTQGTKKNYDITTYNDGIYVGYRYYTTKNVPVSYPFGYGMSYTTFKYNKLVVSKSSNGDITVTVDVKNIGRRPGKEVVQAYVSAPGKDMDKPARELKGFAKTNELQPGETESVTITIPYNSLASFYEKESCWQVEEGTYKVLIAKNAADLNPLTSIVTEEGAVTETVKPCLSLQQN